MAGFIHETIQGVGGAVPLADGYLPAAYKVRALVGGCVALCCRCWLSLLRIVLVAFTSHKGVASWALLAATQVLFAAPLRLCSSSARRAGCASPTLSLIHISQGIVR